MQNLVNKAVEATPPGGMVLLRHRSRETEMVIEVADQGEGIPPDKTAAIFTPFVTTKREGTGLGLAIVKKIVEAHGGTIVVSGNPGGGTVFRLVIPRGGKEKNNKILQGGMV